MLPHLFTPTDLFIIKDGRLELDQEKHNEYVNSFSIYADPEQDGEVFKLFQNFIDAVNNLKKYWPVMTNNSKNLSLERLFNIHGHEKKIVINHYGYIEFKKAFKAKFRL